jgi:hypothetical protein
MASDAALGRHGSAATHGAAVTCGGGGERASGSRLSVKTRRHNGLPGEWQGRWHCPDRGGELQLWTSPVGPGCQGVRRGERRRQIG